MTGKKKLMVLNDVLSIFPSTFQALFIYLSGTCLWGRAIFQLYALSSPLKAEIQVHHLRIWIPSWTGLILWYLMNDADVQVDVDAISATDTEAALV